MSKRWSNPEIERLRDTISENYSIQAISEILTKEFKRDINYNCVRTKIRHLGLENKRHVRKTIMDLDFETQTLPEKEIAVDDLIKNRLKKYNQKHIATEARKLINIKIKINGPIAIAHFGDPHVDDDGTNLGLLLDHIDIVNKTPGMFAGNVGDMQNNWIGRLARLYGQQSTSAKESWKLTEYVVKQLPWLYLIGGNHDVWSGDGDPLEYMMSTSPGIFQNYGARMNLVFPNGKHIRINARHDFKGHSMWNTVHGPAKAIQMGWRAHILTCGHTHVYGYQVLKDPSNGLISHAIRSASYKVMDKYAEEKGLPDQHIFCCPVTIIDPNYEDNDMRCITTIFDPGEASEFLTWKRSKYD